MDTKSIATSKVKADQAGSSAANPQQPSPSLTASADSVRNAPVSTETGTNELSSQQASTLADSAVVEPSANAVIDSK